jgi:hypothetical protein
VSLNNQDDPANFFLVCATTTAVELTSFTATGFDGEVVHEDLCSGSVSRRRRAAEFLGAWGEHGISVSGEIISSRDTENVDGFQSRYSAR